MGIAVSLLTAPLCFCYTTPYTHHVAFVVVRGCCWVYLFGMHMSFWLQQFPVLCRTGDAVWLLGVFSLNFRWSYNATARAIYFVSGHLSFSLLWFISSSHNILCGNGWRGDGWWPNFSLWDFWIFFFKKVEFYFFYFLPMSKVPSTLHPSPLDLLLKFRLLIYIY